MCSFFKYLHYPLVNSLNINEDDILLNGTMWQNNVTSIKGNRESLLKES